MSAVAPLRQPIGLTQPAARPNARPASPATARPRLRLIAPARSTAGRLPFAILLGTVLVAGLVGLLMLHTLAAQDAFRATALQQRLNGLSDTEQQLELVDQRLSAPRAVQARAKTLGMLPTAVTSFRHLPDGRTVGVQTAVTPPPVVPPATSSTTATNTKTTSTKTTGTTATTTATGTNPTPSGGTKAGAKPHHHARPHR